MPTVEEHRIQSSRGQVWLIVHHPTATDRLRGVVISSHGGPGGDHRGNDYVFDTLREALVGLGFACIQFDYYGNGKSDGCPETYDLTSQVEDLRSVVSFATEQFGPARLHLIGESLGSTIVASLNVSGAASIVHLWPAFNLLDTDLGPYFSEEWQERVRTEGRLQDGGLLIGRSFYNEMLSWNYAPLLALSEVPTLLIHGRADNEVPCEQSIEASRRSMGYVELQLYPSAGHGIREPNMRRLVVRNVCRWIQEN